jgi:hypothetical protein
MKQVDKVWFDHNWQRIPELIYLENDNVSTRPEQTVRNVSLTELDLMGDRHSANGFSEIEIDKNRVENLFSEINSILKQNKGFEAVAITHLRDNRTGEREIISPESRRSSANEIIQLSELRDCIQNQWWFYGGGVSLVICVDWGVQAELCPGEHGPLNVWVTAGKIAQHIIHVATSMGLVLRITPAVSDTKMKKLVAHDISGFPIYYLRIGYEGTYEQQTYVDSFDT